MELEELAIRNQLEFARRCRQRLYGQTRHGAERNKYDHRSWHYVNIVAYLEPSDKDAIGPIKTNLSTQPPQGFTKNMDVIQAIEYAKLRVDGTVQVSAEEDALMLCWLLHSYSDFHQPLHSTAMFSKTLLPKGCRGGHSIPTKQSKNLRSLWDGLLGNDNAYQTCHNQAVEMLADKDLAGEGKCGIERRHNRSSRQRFAQGLY